MPSVRLLLVEDEKDSREIMEVIIRRKFPGIELITARDGVEAIEVLGGQAPTVLLTDLNLPKLGGLEVAREARRRWPEVWIVLITGESERPALDSPGLIDSFISKPVDFQRVVSVIEGCLARRRAWAGAC